MADIPDKIKENVRAVLLSKTDGKGVLVNDFLRDYKNILKEPLMYKSLGYSSLPEFLKAIPDICRLDYQENIMAFKLYGIAKPNTYVSSFVRKAEGNVTDDEPDREDRRGGRSRKENRQTGELLDLGSELDEDWEPNCRGLYTLCFPNRYSHLSTSEEVTVKFSQAGSVADVNIITSLVFVRYRDCRAAKKALALWGDELRLKRAEERQPPPKKNSGGRSREKRNNDLLVKPRTGGKVDSERKEDSDDSDWGGGKTVQQNGPSAGKKTESIWSQVRKNENDTSPGSAVKDTSPGIANKVVENKESLQPKVPKIQNDGLLGRAPGDPTSGLLNSIGAKHGLLGEAPVHLSSGVMNGLLAGPVSPVALGRAAVLGRHVPVQASHTVQGPISHSASGGMTQQKTSPVSQLGITGSHTNGPTIHQALAISPKEDIRQVKGMPSEAKSTQKEDMIQVYVGNFPFTANQNDLEQLLVNFDYKSCKIVGCKNNNKKRYAFVDFVSQKEADRCISELNETEFQTRNLQVRYGNRHSELEHKETEAEGQLEDGMKKFHLSPKPSQPSLKNSTASQLEDGMKKVQLSPKPSLPTLKNSQSPKTNQPMQSQNYIEEEDDDEMPPLEEDLPVIKRTIQNDKFDNKDKKSGRQPGSYVPKYPVETPKYLVETPENMPPLEKMPPLETFSPPMPDLEPRTPPKKKLEPEIPIPLMPKPDDSLKVFDSRDLEEEMLHEDESVQLFVSNFHYGTTERDLHDLFEKQSVEQIVIMNNNVTNRSTYAFVTVKNIEQAQFAILQLDQSLMKGRRLTVGMATVPTKQTKSRQEDPIARITCTVGASGDNSRQVSLNDTYSEHCQRDGYNSEQNNRTLPYNRSGYRGDGDFNDDYSDHQYQEDRRNSKFRMTSVLKAYAVIVSKLRGEADFDQPVHSLMKVYVTHVEENGYFFWGQVLVDSTMGTLGFRKNIETLQRITAELQNQENRPAPVKTLGRCAALYHGEWYRAWNMYITEDGRHDILYVDYGNTALLPGKDLATTAFHIWNLPPMSKPFRLTDGARGRTMKGFENKTINIEILAPGNPQSNFVAHVRLLEDDLI